MANTISIDANVFNGFLAKNCKIFVNGNEITNENKNNASQFLLSNGKDVIEYKTINGYIFDGDVYIRYKASKNVRVLMDIVSNNESRFTFPKNSAVEILPSFNSFNKDGVDTPYFTTVLAGSVININSTLNNCTLSPNVSTIPVGSVSNFTLTANNGFKFISSPNVYIMLNGVRQDITLTKVSDYEYTFNVTPNESTEQLYINAVADSETVRLIKNLSNCSVSPAGDTLTIGVPVTLTITANNGYIFDAENTPSLYWIDNEHMEHYLSVTKTSDYEYTATFTPDETDYHLNANAITEPSSVSIEKNLTNCTMSPNVNSFIDGETYNIVLTADAGYIFDVAPSITYQHKEGNIVPLSLTKVSDYVYKYDGLTVDSTKELEYTITAYASIESVTSTKYGVLQIHKIDANKLKEFNDLRYYSGHGSLSQIDLSKYISALKVIFVDATSTANDNILVADVNTGLQAPKIDDDYITLDLGNVLLAGMYQNTLDKKYSEIFLNLPFVDVYKLDSAYMNETINIKYRVNLISGDGAIFISIVRDNETFLIDVINVNMSFDLPYIYPIESDIKQFNTKIKAINFNVSPTVTIKQRLKADANNNIYQCYKIDTPANENGYFKIERLNADTIPANASIRNKIENLLKAGVYI